MPGRSFNTGDYRYGFNGQEKDDEIKGSGNHIDFAHRGYDPRLGRFITTDPLESLYPFQTPYAFAQNTPIWAIDIEGLEAWIATQTTDVMSIEDFDQFAKAEIDKATSDETLEGTMDCADFSLYVVTKYFQSKGVEFTFTDYAGNKMSSSDKKYTNYKDFFEDLKLRAGSKEVLNNTFEIPNERSASGDIIMSNSNNHVIVNNPQPGDENWNFAQAQGSYQGEENPDTKAYGPEKIRAANRKQSDQKTRRFDNLKNVKQESIIKLEPKGISNVTREE